MSHTHIVGRQNAIAIYGYYLKSTTYVKTIYLQDIRTSGRQAKVEAVSKTGQFN